MNSAWPTAADDLNPFSDRPRWVSSSGPFTMPDRDPNYPAIGEGVSLTMRLDLRVLGFDDLDDFDLSDVSSAVWDAIEAQTNDRLWLEGSHLSDVASRPPLWRRVWVVLTGRLWVYERD